MSDFKKLTTDNIPDDVKVGQGNMTIFEVHDEVMFKTLKPQIDAFCLKDTDGRMYIKCGLRTKKALEEAGLA